MTANADIPAGDGERRHDPLCPQRQGSMFCTCDLIARVREDERKSSCAEDLHTDCPCYREGRNVADDDVTFWEPHYQAGYTHGYGAALRDATAAVQSREDGDYFPWPQVLIATAAITDLQP